MTPVLLALALVASPLSSGLSPNTGSQPPGCTQTSTTTLRRYREAAILNAAAADLSAAQALALQQQLADLQSQPPPAAPEPAGPPWAWILGAGGVGLALGAIAMGVALTVEK